MLRSLATAISAAATSRVWATLPAAPSSSAGGDGLHRVDDHQVGRHGVDVAEDGGQVGLGGQEERAGHRLDPLGPQPHLGGRLLAGDVEHPPPLAGGAGGDVEQQGGLADAGLAGHQHDRARHQPAAEDPVELADAGRVGLGQRDVDVVDRSGRAR